MSHFLAKQGGTWGAYNAQALYKKENGSWKKCDWTELNEKSYQFEFVPQARKTINYVSLGDSIAAGHNIDDGWSATYGEGSQYGKNGNQRTTIVPNCYTDLIKKELESVYGANNVSVSSFARSGDTVADLMSKLSHEAVITAIQNADLVSICIGANDVLEPAMSHLDQYINYGDLSQLEGIVSANMKKLSGELESGIENGVTVYYTSYKDLFDRLSELNPNAKYVFTTIYNPYKYLWLKEGKDGFFAPMLSVMPDFTIDIEGFLGINIPGVDLKYDIDIKSAFLDMSIVKQLFSRINGLNAWVEMCVEGTSTFDGLNRVLRKAISGYQGVNPNFSVADTKVLFDLFPNRTETSSDVDYSDLVSVEFTSTFDTAKMDWGKLWPGSDPGAFFNDLLWKYLKIENAFPSINVTDYVYFNMNGYVTELVSLVVERVVAPDVDPHPETHGHAVLKRAFTNMWGLISYDPGEGTSVHGDVVLKGGNLPYTKSTKSGTEFSAWCSDPNLTQYINPGSEFSNYKAEGSHTLTDLVNGNSVISKTPKITNLYAKWR